MCFSGDTLAIVTPVKPEMFCPIDIYKMDISVQSLCTTISSGAGASD